MAHPSPEVALAITRQKARYCRFADTKQWDKFATDIALPEARYEMCDVDGRPLKAGKQALVFDSSRACATFFKRFFEPLQTMHNFGPGDFEQVKPDEVKVIWGFEDQVMSKVLGSWAEIRGGGYYHETYRLVNGEWYIENLRMVRTYQKATILVSVVLRIAGWLGISP